MVRKVLLAMAAAVLIAGCQTPSGRVETAPGDAGPAPVFNASRYERIPDESGRVFWIDTESSQVRFYLYRGGPLAARGHNHVMVVKNLEGAVFVPADMLEDKMRFDVVFPAEQIEVDPPALRQELGGAFATEIPPEGVRGTREHMLGEKVLNAQRFATIGLSPNQVYGEMPKLALDTVITLHGIRHRQWVPATVTVNGDRLSATGAFVIDQSDYGIKPFSALGGAL
jgi:hypothetical protein